MAYGPSGTGKTALAVWKGLQYYDRQKVDGLVITRPIVQVDGDIGTFPGDEDEKYKPYMEVIDQFLMDYPGYQRLKGSTKIDFVPLELMRGRTFENRFVILDEAQNTTISQMKMFLTRLGKESRMVITGDLRQCDLRPGVKNGLQDAIERFEDNRHFGFVRFKTEDIQRHGIIAEIIKAYEGE